QKCREGSAANSVAFRQSLGGVAHRVQTIGFLANLIGLLTHFDNTASIIGNRSKRIHRQDVGRRTQHAHGGHRGAEKATRKHEYLSLNGFFDDHPATLSKRIRGNDRYTNHDDWESCRLHAYRHTSNNIGCWASL